MNGKKKNGKSGIDIMLDITLIVTFITVITLALYVSWHIKKAHERDAEYEREYPKILEEVKSGHANGVDHEDNLSVLKERGELEEWRDKSGSYRMWAIGIVAETLWREARGEGKAGIRAVASVVWNRSRERQLRPEKVCLQKAQFSCWNGVAIPLPTDIWKKTGEKTHGSGFRIWRYCVGCAERIVDGTFVPTVSANHYYNPRMCRPKWGKSMRGAVKIGRHRFGSI